MQCPHQRPKPDGHRQDVRRVAQRRSVVRSLSRPARGPWMRFPRGLQRARCAGLPGGALDGRITGTQRRPGRCSLGGSARAVIAKGGVTPQRWLLYTRRHSAVRLRVVVHLARFVATLQYEAVATPSRRSRPVAPESRLRAWRPIGRRACATLREKPLDTVVLVGAMAETDYAALHPSCCPSCYPVSTAWDRNPTIAPGAITVTSSPSSTRPSVSVSDVMMPAPSRGNFTASTTPSAA
jgi:hypothetical protein